MDSCIVHKNKTIKTLVDNKFKLLLPFLCTISAILVCVFSGIYKDSDTLWSIRVGYWIAENKTFPHADVFSWTVNGKPWIAMEWLFCYIIYEAQKLLSFFGIIVLVSIIYLATSYLLSAVCTSINPHVSSVWVYCLGTFFLTYFSTTPRAYIFTFLYLAYLIYVLRLKKEKWQIFTLPILFILWGNTQSSALLGAVILLAEAVMRVIMERKYKLLPVSAISIIATLVNPYGVKMWAYLIKFLFKPENKMILEWQAPNFDNRLILIIYAVIGITGVIFSYQAYIKLRTKKKEKKFDYIMIFIWFWISLGYAFTCVRGIYYCMIFWMPFACAFMPKKVKKLFNLKPIFAAGIFGIFTAFLLYCAQFAEFNVFPPNVLPINAVNFLKENPKYTDRMFNDYMYGGILAYEGIQTFIDSRADVFIENGVFQDYMYAENLYVNPEDIIDKYRISTFFISQNSRLAIYISGRPEWNIVYSDETSIIYSSLPSQ